MITSMEQNHPIDLLVEYQTVSASQKTSSQYPGRLRQVGSTSTDQKELPIPAFTANFQTYKRKIKFLRFTVKTEESRLTVRVRDALGVSFDGPATTFWAQDALQSLINQDEFEIQADDALGKFKGLLNAQKHDDTTPEPVQPDLKSEPLYEYPELSSFNGLFPDIKTEPVDLFADWVEPTL